MPHEFIPREEEPEAQPAGSRRGNPPRKRTAVGVLDPSLRPKKPVGPNKPIKRSPLSRAIVILILTGLAALAVAIAWQLL
jgi:hypothetical protein